LEAALAQAEQSLKDGAESMRPDAEIVGAEEEIRRLLPAVLALKQSGCDPKCRINGFLGV
jgi:dihydropteroate synthase